MTEELQTLQVISSYVVLVKIRGPDPKEMKIKNRPFYLTQDGSTSLSASGTILNAELGIILCTASILYPFFNRQTTSLELIRGTEITIFVQSLANSANSEGEEEFKLQSFNAQLASGLIHNESIDKWIYQLTQGSSEWYWGYVNGNNANSVSYADMSVPSNNSKPYSPSAFVLLQVPLHQRTTLVHLLQSPVTFSSTSQSPPTLSKRLLIPKFQPSVQQGQRIYVIGSPFGLLSPYTFQNSITSGIVSNIFGRSKHHVLLTDARMLPGTEGGAIVNKNGEVIAFASLPLKRVDGSSVELHVAICYDALSDGIHKWIEKLVQKHSDEISSQDNKKKRGFFNHSNASSTNHKLSLHTSPQNNNNTSNHLSLCRESLVLIHIGSSWASGILLSNDGYILTNAHLIKPYLDGDRIKLNTDMFVQLEYELMRGKVRYFAAELIFVIMKGPLDLALIKVRKSLSGSIREIHGTRKAEKEEILPCKGVNLSCNFKLVRGQSVYVIGYPLFFPSGSSASLIKSTITKGKLSSIVYYSNKPNEIKKPAMIQTSALVHQGNSGGMVVDARGRFLGIVTSNAKHKTQSTSPSSSSSRSSSSSSGNTTNNEERVTLIPSMNFAVPVHLLMGFSDFMIKKDLSILRKIYDTENEILNQIWSFSSKEPTPYINSQVPMGSKWNKKKLNNNNTTTTTNTTTDTTNTTNTTMNNQQSINESLPVVQSKL